MSLPVSAAEASPSVTTRYTVLVLDTSSSSDFLGSDGTVFYTADTAIDYVKIASKKFVESMSKADGTNYIAIVEYQGDGASTVCGFTNSTSQLNNAIDSLSAAKNTRNVAAGLQTADSLVASVGDEEAIKNVVLFTTGMTNAGEYSYDGHYDESSVGSSWFRTDTEIHLYAYANSAWFAAENLKEKAYLYSIGLFQPFEDMPAQGESIVAFFKLFAKDCATSASYFYDVANPEDLEIIFGRVADEVVDETSIDVNLSYSSYSLPAHFSESYFYYPSYEYNHSLAWLSLCLELSSFSKKEYECWGDSGVTAAECRTENLSDAYNQLGFSDSVEFYNYNISLNDTSDKAAYAIASRKLTTGETLISVVLRGGGYGCEWSSNFHVGAGEYYHAAFNAAATSAYQNVVKHVEKTNGKCKIWVTGYSRGAAVANLLTAKLDDYSKTSSQVDAADIFAYTFATPQGVTKNMHPSDAIYNNIFNIINPGDAVPEVAPTAWGFTRFGITKRFDSKVNRSNQQLINAKYAEFGNNSFDVKANLKLASTIKALMKIITKAFPTCEEAIPVQLAIADYLEYKFTRYNASSNAESPSWKSISFTDFYNKMYNRYGEAFLQAFITAELFLIDDNLMGRFSSSYATEEVALLLALCETHGLPLEKAIDVLSSLINIPTIATILLHKDSFGGLGESHLPETYLAWMYQEEHVTFGTSTSGSNHTWVISLHCPIDIAVYDRNGAVVAQVVDHKIVNEDSVDVAVVIDDESTELFFDETSDEYRIEISPTSHGTMSYTVTELDDNDNLIRRINYLDIPINPNESIFGDVAFAEEYTDGMYDLHSEQNGVSVIIPPSEVFSTEKTYTVNVEEMQGGSVSGTGLYLKGDTATMRAYPNEGYAFAGWYQNDNLRSTESIYRIQIQEDISLKAKFVPSSCDHVWGDGTIVDVNGLNDLIALGYRCKKCGLFKSDVCNSCIFDDVSSGTWYYKPVLWASFTGITAGTSATSFSPKEGCTRAQVVTFLWRSAGSPEPEGSDNPFVDVLPGT